MVGDGDNRLSRLTNDVMLARLRGGSDGERRAANAEACRGGLQGRGGQRSLSEKAAMAGNQLYPTSICGYFRNLSSLL